MKPVLFEAPLLLIALGIIVYQLFVPPLIGMADSYDFERLLSQNGLAHVSTDYNERYFHYFNSRYKIIPRAVPSDPQDLGATKSSTSIPMRLARRLSIALGQDEFFDIRFQAALYTLILLLGSWLIIASTRPLGPSVRVVVCALIVLILTDVGYVSYFNSFYSEGTAFALLTVVIGCSVALITRQSSNVFLLIGYFLASGLVVTSKPQYAPMVLVFAPFGVYITSYVRSVRRYRVAGIMAIALCFVGIWYYSQVSEIFKVNTVYIEIFMDLLPNSTNPGQDLAEMGLNPDYAHFSETTPYQPDSPLNDAEFRNEFSSRIGPLTVPLFYLSHPGRLYGLCARCARHAFSTRVGRSGYYEQSSGKPPYSRPFGIWSIVRERVFPRSVFFLGFFFATGIASAVLLMRTSSMRFRGLALLHTLFVFIAAVQFFIAVMVGGGEPDLEKHLFMFNLAFDVCLILIVIGTAGLVQTFKPSLLMSKLRALKHT